MEAVHFGAGNIGRGFIGSLLYRSNFHTTFVDVNKEVINAINEKNQYKVILASEQQEEEIVENITGMNSLEDPESVVDQIVKADIITTAVGPNVLSIIAKLIAKGLTKRIKQTTTPLNIIACENMIGGSALLKEKVLEYIDEADKETFEELFAFPNAAVDRIVPNQTNKDILTVSVEPYFEWVIEDDLIKGESPPIDGVTYVRDLGPFIERKLFTVNTGHAVAAYLGYYLGYQTIKETMDAPIVKSFVMATLKETGAVLVKQYGFEAEKHQQYIDKIINRFLNPHISDEVTRVGRGPLRKLGGNDRLIRPASLYLETLEKEPTYLAKAIAATLQFDYREDEEAVSLQKSIKEQGYEKALLAVSGLDKDHPLIPIVLKELETLNEIKAN
ncbi:mannitol-1-phosphate 5-dehydrogenase [Paraliobacillus zengyii]|uniref:mannitol-1-phosphate 5-dehydrogenase n=1 Tax=Paraliobacillus zengyii TaxID=2213194 RepID=UPI000E3C2BC4|nr:mannitol-1-phosphate 5-dehydrogenase [Paraliobacillus zengyii]